MRAAVEAMAFGVIVTLGVIGAAGLVARAIGATR